MSLQYDCPCQHAVAAVPATQPVAHPLLPLTEYAVYGCSPAVTVALA